MSNPSNKGVLRLRRYHEPDPEAPPDIDIGRRLIAVQSVRNALVASLIVIVLFTLLWTLLSLAIERVFPWLCLLLGAALGLAVRRAGLGIDWRFPALAAAMSLAGSLLAYSIVVAGFMADTYQTNLAGLLSEIAETGTWFDFFAEVIGPAEVILAAFTAGLAAFFSTRRLSRRQYLALRLYRQSLI